MGEDPDSNPSHGRGGRERELLGPGPLSLKHPDPLAAEENEQEEKSRSRGSICKLTRERLLMEKNGACFDRNGKH